MKKYGILICVVMCLMMLAGCGKKSSELDPQNPTSVVIWHYYNGNQQEAFDTLINEFNDTKGAELGIIVSAESKGDVNELAQAVKDSAAKKAGAGGLPDMFATYADPAYTLSKQDKLVDLRDYMTQEEIDEYVPAFMDEGKLGTDGLYIMPVAKSTELLYVNETDWKVFAEATGADKGALATWEGIAKTAEQYYDWSGGKAFFGRDAFPNYVIVGSRQLGSEIFTATEKGVEVKLDEKAMRKLWEYYCAPYLKGYYGSYGRFRSDDVKTGDLVAYVGSTSSASYYPKEVTKEDGTTYPIEGGVYNLPDFEGTDGCSVQQGAGMAVVKSEKNREEAAAAFLKWFTDVEQNTRFSVDSGYFPVKVQANTEANMQKAMEQAGIDINGMAYENAILGVEAVTGGELCTDESYAAKKDFRGTLTEYLTGWLDTKKAGLDGKTKEEKETAMDVLFAEWMEGLKSDLHE